MHNPQGPLQVAGFPTDSFNPQIPPRELPGLDEPGWAYGAFALARFTTYDPASRILDLYYLLSLNSPYQLQVMHSKLEVDLFELSESPVFRQ